MKAETEAEIRRIVAANAVRREVWRTASRAAHAAYQAWNTPGHTIEEATRLHEASHQAAKAEAAAQAAYERGATEAFIVIEMLLQLDGGGS